MIKLYRKFLLIFIGGMMFINVTHCATTPSGNGGGDPIDPPPSDLSEVDDYTLFIKKIYDKEYESEAILSTPKGFENSLSYSLSSNTDGIMIEIVKNDGIDHSKKGFISFINKDTSDVLAKGENISWNEGKFLIEFKANGFNPEVGSNYIIRRTGFNLETQKEFYTDIPIKITL